MAAVSGTLFFREFASNSRGKLINSRGKFPLVEARTAV